jgi:RNA polymerase sigma factor (sigma-70 family)
MENWFARLRLRFVDVARQRVADEDVEDVVQEALRIVHEKRAVVTENLVEGMPPLAWCFQVLRHTIGNYYSRTRTSRRFVTTAEPDAESTGTPGSGGSTPLEALESEESLKMIEQSLTNLKRRDPQCGRYLQRTLEGDSAREIAHSEQLAEAVFYRRLYRCRSKLRRLLEESGVRV